MPYAAAVPPAMPRPLLTDVTLAVALTGLSLAVLVVHATGPLPGSTYVLAVLSAAPVALRQVAPMTTMGVVLVASCGYTFVSPHGSLPTNGFGILLGMFTVATLRSWRAAATMFAATTLLLVTLFVKSAEAMWPEYLIAGLIVLSVWALGESTRRWSRRAQDLAAQSAAAVAAERVRIARELHDVVAHHVAVISLQAGVAEYVLDSDPDTARRAITTVGVSSRDALAEMRRMLFVLRAPDPGDPDDAYGQPGLASLEQLADRLRAAGLPIAVHARGDVRDLPAGSDLTAYRVVQESLTNVVKHAGPASARVELDFGPSTLTISVTDDGAGVPVGGPGPDTHGIRGMRERVELFGGTLVAEPSTHGGFTVLARMPIPEAS